MTGEQRYAGFISYSDAADGDLATWLHRSLESYRVPEALTGRDGPDGPIGKRLGDFYLKRPRGEGRELDSESRSVLDRSEALIVLSPVRSAQRDDVNEQIRYFQSLGRSERIMTALVEAEPEDVAKSFTWTKLEGGTNGHAAASETSHRYGPIAADFRGDNRARNVAKIKLIAALLDVEEEELVQRDRAAARGRHAAYAAASAIGIVLAVSAGDFAWRSINSAQQLAKESSGQTLVAAVQPEPAPAPMPATPAAVPVQTAAAAPQPVRTTVIAPAPGPDSPRAGPIQSAKAAPPASPPRAIQSAAAKASPVRSAPAAPRPVAPPVRVATATPRPAAPAAPSATAAPRPAAPPVRVATATPRPTAPPATAAPRPTAPPVQVATAPPRPAAPAATATPRPAAPPAQVATAPPRPAAPPVQMTTATPRPAAPAPQAVQSAAAAPPAATVVAVADTRPQDAALQQMREFGAAQSVAVRCEGRGNQASRDRARALIASSPQGHQNHLINAFNEGYRAAEGRADACPAAASS